MYAVIANAKRTTTTTVVAMRLAAVSCFIRWRFLRRFELVDSTLGVFFVFADTAGLIIVSSNSCSGVFLTVASPFQP